MPRRKHPNTDIEQALRFVESKGWRVELGGSHAWGKTYCPFNDKSCRGGQFCINSIWSTPRNPANHAKQIRRAVTKCIHLSEDE